MLRGMWDLPGPGIEPVSPALAGGFLTTEPPEKSQGSFFSKQLFYMVHTIWGKIKLLPPLNCFGTLVKFLFFICLWSISRLCFVPLIYLSILIPISHCLDYYNFMSWNQVVLALQLYSFSKSFWLFCIL